MDKFPHAVGEMQHATWLKLNNTALERVPDELSNLTKLEHLQMYVNIHQLCLHLRARSLANSTAVNKPKVDFQTTIERTFF